MTKSKGNKQSGSDPARDNERVVTTNRRAKFEYDILDTLECGVVLVGSEVKSLRNGKCLIDDAYGRMKQGEVWLMGADIPEYLEANRFNHDPKRPRKLLLHRREINKVALKAYETGHTLVPLKVYFKNGRAKLLLGIGKGRKMHDKREVMKKRTAQREMDRVMKQHR